MLMSIILFYSTNAVCLLQLDSTLLDLAKARRTEFVETVMKEVGLSLGVADDLEKSLRIGRCLLLLKVGFFAESWFRAFRD